MKSTDPNNNPLKKKTPREPSLAIPILSNPIPGERMVRTVYDMEYAFHWCPAGSFIMGSPEKEIGRYIDEIQHQVILTKGFWMLETQVTVGMFRQFTSRSRYKSAGETPWGWNGEELVENPKYSWRNPGFPQTNSHPVVNVSWHDAQAFCVWLGRRLKAHVTLPTEAQWEYACRAGTTTALNNGKDLTDEIYDCANLNEVAWYNWQNQNIMTSHEVAQKRPNAWGLYDMHGNVWEWCADWEGPYPSGPTTDPTGKLYSMDRVVRGGGWNNDAEYCRSANRLSDFPKIRDINIGFRVILIP
ncbi:MAG: formylglycine-generating enzyme family protein [Planctomycetia bacterium]|nr:formylglycine-generating enzyme family protein [Planctomycetia bacterium]